MKEIIKQSKSKGDVLLKYFGYANKHSYDKLNKFIFQNNIDISHFEKQQVYCLCCNSIVIGDSRKMFCDRSCAAKFNNRKRKLTIETKNKISNTLKAKTHPIKISSTLCVQKKICVICGVEFNVKKTHLGKHSQSKTCSKKCSTELRIINGRISINKQIKNGTHVGWSTRKLVSYPEQFFMDVLKNNGIEFKHNHPVKQRDLGIDSNYNYFLDFYIESKMIDLEIDGSQHKYRKQSDIDRDESLTKNGYKVYRIAWKKINTENGKEYIKNEIEKFLKFYIE